MGTHHVVIYILPSITVINFMKVLERISKVIKIQLLWPCAKFLVNQYNSHWSISVNWTERLILPGCFYLTKCALVKNLIWDWSVRSAHTKGLSDHLADCCCKHCRLKYRSALQSIKQRVLVRVRGDTNILHRCGFMVCVSPPSLICRPSHFCFSTYLVSCCVRLIAAPLGKSLHPFPIVFLPPLPSFFWFVLFSFIHSFDK